MTDSDFCNLLEYQITKAFRYSAKDLIRELWCDGILLPTSEIELSKKSVNDKGKISMTAFIGRNGQERYQLNLEFGSKSLSRYARGLDIKECIPDFASSDRYNINSTNKTITIYLL